MSVRIPPWIGHAWRWMVERTSRTSGISRSLVDRGLPGVVRLTRSRPVRVAGRILTVIVVATVGAVVGLLLNGSTEHNVGPFNSTFTLTPSLSGETQVQVPPVGSLILDSHDAPFTVTVTLGNLDPGRTQQLISDPKALDHASRTAMTDLEAGMKELAVTAGLSALAGALLLSLLVFRRDARRIAGTAVVAVGLLAGTAGLGYATFHPRSIEEPRYEGLLVNAPAVVGDARRIADRYDEYRAQLQRLVRNVSKLYTTISTLPVYEPDQATIRVLHVSDLHLNPASFDLIATVTKQFGVNVVVDTGDITDWGSDREGQMYASGISKIDAPYVYIRGNHDSRRVQRAVAAEDNAIVLDNHIGTVHGLTFAGIGDPRFTPDKSRSDEYTNAGLRLHTGTLVDTVRASHRKVDVALVHDPASAPPLDGVTPVVLAGHLHKRVVNRMEQGTLLMVEGSTGGAGLRGLEHEKPTALRMSVLYFDRDTHALQAYDDIVVGGTGLSEVTLERRVLDTSPGAAPAPPNGSPSRSAPSPRGSPG